MIIDLIHTTETKMTFKISFRTTEKRNERKKVEREKANHNCMKPDRWVHIKTETEIINLEKHDRDTLICPLNFVMVVCVTLLC